MRRVMDTALDKTDFKPGSSDVYLDLLESIIAQQLSGKVARVITSRFHALFEGQYPAPAALLDKDVPTLRSIGLSQQKATYMHHVAQYFSAQALEHTKWSDLSDEQVVERLTQIKGVGRWTAEMVLIFTLNRPDVMPVDDLGIQQSMSLLYGWNYRGKALKAQMRIAAEPWRPYRSYACRLLWRWPRI